VGVAQRYYALQGGWVGKKRQFSALRNYAMAPIQAAYTMKITCLRWHSLGSLCVAGSSPALNVTASMYCLGIW